MRVLRHFISVLIIVLAFPACRIFYKEKTEAVPIDSSRNWSYAAIRDRVLGPKCVGCHGAAGGVSLESYEEVKRNLDGIYRTAIVNKTMPKGSILNPSQMALLKAWIEEGAPEGNTSVLPPDEPLKPNYASLLKLVFQKKCTSCHNPDGDAWNIPLEPYSDLMNSSLNLVVLGNPDTSGLMIAITRTDSKRMPPAPAKPLSADEISVIRDWILQNAPEN